MSDEMHERLRLAREHAGYKAAAEAARAFGWSVDAYKSHENGLRGIKRSVAVAYAKAYRVDPEWILFGRSPPRWLLTPMQQSRPIRTRLAPQIAWASVGVYCSIGPDAEGVAIVAEHEIDAIANIGLGTFWLAVSDSAMRATQGGVSFEVGDLIACDPAATVEPGNFVIAIPDNSSDPVLRRAQLRSAGASPAWDLMPLNPDYPTLHISGTSTGRILARVIRRTHAL